MRRKQARDSKKNPVRDSPKEVLAEGIVKKGLRFNEEEIQYICNRRKKLIEEGFKDMGIALEIAHEIQRDQISIYQFMRSLAKNGKIPVNPNRSIEFSDQEIEAFTTARGDLIAKGFMDGTIARMLSDGSGRSEGTICQLFNRLRKEDKIPENPNKQKQRIFSDEEIQQIMKRRQELIAKGMQDTHISKLLSTEITHSAGSIHSCIHRLIKQGTLQPNPHKQNEISDQEKSLLIRKRETLISSGYTDYSIGEILAKEIRNSPSTVRNLFFRLSKKGKIIANPNKKEHSSFSEDELNSLAYKYNELVAQGYNDSQIAKQYAKQTRRNPGSVEKKIRDLREKGAFGANPNVQIKFTKQEIEIIIRRRNELEHQGLNDTSISFIVGNEIGRSQISIISQICQLVKKGKLAINKNAKRHRHFSKDEVATFVSLRNELLKKGKKEGYIISFIAGKLKRSKSSVKKLSSRLVKEGKTEKNPSTKKHREFSEDDTAFLIKRREELALDGLNDADISSSLADVLGRSEKCLDSKIKLLIDKGELAENPNKKEKFSDQETKMLLSRREELMSKGLNDWQIAQKVGPELGRSAIAAIHKISRLVESGETPTNPNKRIAKSRGFYSKMSDDALTEYTIKLLKEEGINNRQELRSSKPNLYLILVKRNLLGRVFPEFAKKSESELLAQLKDAVELYLGNGDEE